jgi:predicted dehydrogenase
MHSMQTLFEPASYQPSFPADRSRFGIGIIGCGTVALKWHLPVYHANGLWVVGVWDRDPAACAAASAAYPALRVYATLEELLSDSAITIVDIATNVTGRAELIIRGLAANKHILAQKPLCRTAAELAAIESAAKANPSLRVAVNHNGRWAPPWRVASQLIASGMIGDLVAISHLHDIRMQWLPDLDRHGSPLFLVFDYALHWVDISLCWLGGRQVRRVWCNVVSRARPEGLVSQIAWLNFLADDDICVSIRSVTAAQRYSGHPFVVHGTTGTLRGAVDAPVGGDYLEIDNGTTLVRPILQGNWFPDGFVGAIAELLSSIQEHREPSHSLRHAARSHRVILAACASAESGGVPIVVDQ